LVHKIARKKSAIEIHHLHVDGDEVTELADISNKICFIQGFLKNRKFHVRLVTCISDLFDQEMGVPQGSILSVTLFCLKINSIIKAISPGVECSLYMDDFLICYRSKHTHNRMAFAAVSQQTVSLDQ